MSERYQPNNSDKMTRRELLRFAVKGAAVAGGTFYLGGCSQPDRAPLATVTPVRPQVPDRIPVAPTVVPTKTSTPPKKVSTFPTETPNFQGLSDYTASQNYLFKFRHPLDEQRAEGTDGAIDFNSPAYVVARVFETDNDADREIWYKTSQRTDKVGVSHNVYENMTIIAATGLESQANLDRYKAYLQQSFYENLNSVNMNRSTSQVNLTFSPQEAIQKGTIPVEPYYIKRTDEDGLNINAKGYLFVVNQPVRGEMWKYGYRVVRASIKPLTQEDDNLLLGVLRTLSLQGNTQQGK